MPAMVVSREFELASLPWAGEPAQVIDRHRRGRGISFRRFRNLLDLSMAFHPRTLPTVENRCERARRRMVRISELAESVGLSRGTLHHYEKLGLLKGKRQANGYRVYSGADRQRLRLMQQLQAGGLSLQECRACLDAKLDREILGQRLAVLDAEIAVMEAGRGQFGYEMFVLERL